MSAPDPRQFYTKLHEVQEKFGGLTQSSQFMVQLGLAGSGGYGSSSSVESHLLNSDVFDKNNRTDDFNFFCSEATLPGSTFDVMELQGARQGLIERIPNRRVYTDFDVTFYLDDEYKILRLFEEWMNYIDPLYNAATVYTGSEKGMSGFADSNCFQRLRYPNSYKRPVMIHKFERNLLKNKTMNSRSSDVRDRSKFNVLTYIFLEAFPMNIQAIPFSYDGSTITKVSVNFSYTRYMVCKNSGMGQSANQFLAAAQPQNSEAFTFGDVFNVPFSAGLAAGGSTILGASAYSENYDLDLNVFGGGSTVDFNAGVQAWDTSILQEAFFGYPAGESSSSPSPEATREVQRVEPSSPPPNQQQRRSQQETNESWSLDQINAASETLRTLPGGDVPAPPVSQIRPKRTHRKPTGSENPANSNPLSVGFPGAF